MKHLESHTLSFFFLLLLSTIFGCSIQKRQHNGGFYIQWHKHYHSSDSKHEKQKLKDTITEVVDLDTIIERDTISAVIKVDSVINNKPIKKHEKLPVLPREERKFEPLGVLAFKIFLLDIPVGFFLDNVGLNDIKANTRLGLLFFAVLSVSLILAVISMIRYFRNPKHYKFNIFAILVILVALFFIIEFLCGNMAVVIKLKSLFSFS